MSVTKEDYLRKQEVLKLWGQIVDLFATKSSVTTLQGYFTDGKAKKALADGDGNTISSTYLKLSGGWMNNDVGISWKNSGGQNVDALITYSSSNLFYLGYGQRNVGDTLLYGKELKFYTGTTSRMTIGNDGKVTIAGQLQLGSTTGTAPLIISSTTLVSNLNADLLDGQEGSYYATASSVTTLQGYFTSGVANSAAKLSTSKVGDTNKPVYFTANGVPSAISYTIDKSVPSDAVFTDTATAVDDILDGSNSGTAITYAPYTSRQSKLCFYTGTTSPNGTTRLNLNGYLYATKLYSGGTEVSVQGHTHAYLPLAGGVMNNNVSIGWKDTSSENVGNLVSYNTSNEFVLGYSQRTVGATKIFGKTLSFTTNGNLAATIDASKNFISEGDIKLNNNQGIYFKDYTANTYREVLKLDYTDLLSLGYETGEQGYDTSIWGSQVILSAYDGSEYQDIATAKVENGTNKLEVSGNLILTKSSYTSNGLSLDASGNMKVSDGARLTDIYGSAIKFYIGSSEAAAIDSANKNLTSQGSVIGMRGVAAYGIADLSIISNT